MSLLVNDFQKKLDNALKEPLLDSLHAVKVGLPELTNNLEVAIRDARYKKIVIAITKLQELEKEILELKERNKILTEALKDYINITGMASTVLPDVEPADSGYLDVLEEFTRAACDLIEFERGPDPLGPSKAVLTKDLYEAYEKYKKIKFSE